MVLGHLESNLKKDKIKSIYQYSKLIRVLNAKT